MAGLRSWQRTATPVSRPPCPPGNSIGNCGNDPVTNARVSVEGEDVPRLPDWRDQRPGVAYLAQAKTITPPTGAGTGTARPDGARPRSGSARWPPAGRRPASFDETSPCSVTG